jgi:hypothetical protein
MAELAANGFRAALLDARRSWMYKYIHGTMYSPCEKPMWISGRHGGPPTRSSLLPHPSTSRSQGVPLTAQLVRVVPATPPFDV